MNIRLTLTGAVIAISCLALTPNLHAEEAKLEIKASTTIKNVLVERVGKKAILRMQSGADIDGTVSMVGNSVVHISKLTGKDFYDAVVNIDQISAVLVQERER